MSKLLLIDSRVVDVSVIEASLLPGVDVISFNYFTDSFEDVKNLIVKSYDSVCIAQHNYAKPEAKFLDCMVGADIIDVETTDPNLTTWTPVIDFFTWLHMERGVQTIDLLACFLWANPNWRYVIGKMETDIGIDIRASLNITGDQGDFIMESDGVDLIGVYFTNDILNYKHSFFYAPNAISSPHNSWDTPIDLPLGGGTITAAKYATFIGTMIGCSLPSSATLINPPASINNVVNLFYTSAYSLPYAYAALTSTGQLVCWGSSKGGADVSGVSANLTSGVSKVFTAGLYFTALKTDGTAYCWGYYSDGTSVDTYNTSNRTPPATMTGVVDVATCYNYSATAILKSNGSVQVWGQINGWTNLSTALSLLNSGCSKIYGGYSNNNAYGFMVVKTDGSFVVFGNSGYATSSTFGISGITEMFPTDYGALAYNGTTKVMYKLTGTATAVYTVPAGVTITRVVPQSSSYDAYIMLSNGNVYNTATSSLITGVVSQICVTDTSAWAYIKNGAVVCGGDTRFGGSTTDTNNGIKSGISVSSGVIKLCSSGGSIAALKSDGTVAVWGANYGGWPAASAIQSQLTSVVHLYDCWAGYIAITSDNRVIVWGSDNCKWYGTPSPNTSQNATIASGYNMSLFNTYKSFAPIDVPSQVVLSPSTLTPGVSTNLDITTTYQHKRAVKGRTYKMYDVNNNLLSTYVAPADTYTLSFNDVTMPADSTNFTIVDTTDASFNILSYVPPPAPTITSVTAGNKSASVSFTTGDLQGVPVTKYQYSTDGTTWTDASGTTSPLTITGLTAGVSTVIYLKQFNSYGGSGASSASTSFTPYDVPSTPTITSVVAGDTQIVVNYNTSALNGLSITGAQYSLNGGAYTNAVTYSSSTVTVTGLTNGTSYTVAIKVITSAGTSPASTTSSSIMPYPAPAAPGAPTITGVTWGNGTASIAFTDGSNTGPSILGYKYSVSGGSYSVAAGTTSPLVITGLTNNTSYTFTIKAFNAGGDSAASNSSTAGKPYALPSTPYITDITMPASQTLKLSVIPANAYNASTLTYSYSLNGGAYTTGTLDASNNITITGLTNGTSYAVTLKATTEFGSSGVSNTITRTPYTTPSAPTSLSSTSGYRQGTVSVTNGDMQGTTFMGYKYKINGGATEYCASTSPFNVYDLTNGSTYDITVSAIGSNASGAFQSAYTSTATTLSPVTTLPDAPSIVSSSSGYKQGTVVVSPNNMQGMTIMGYKYKIDGGATEYWADSSAVVVTGLTNGNTYSITVSVVGSNANGWFQSAYSATSATLSPITTLPDVPTIDSVVPGNTIGVVTMSNNSLNGLTFLGYKYKVNGGTTEYWSAVSPFTVTGLTNDVSASVVVSTVAYNSNGVFQSSYSSATSFMPFATLPDPPTFVSVEPGNGSVFVKFSPGNDNGMNVTGYKYTVDDTNYYFAAADSSHQYTIIGLMNGTSYSIKMIAVAETGNSLPSSSSTSFIPYTFPDAPTITSVVPGDSQICVNFTDGSANGRSITGYKYSLNSAAYVDATGVSNGSFYITGLENEVLYSVRMRATNLAGDSYSSIPSDPVLTYTTPGVPTITGVTPADQSIVVNLKLPDMEGSVLSAYEYSIDGGSTWNSVDASASILSYMTDSFTISGLTNGQSYAVKLRIVGSGGTSDSSAASATVIPRKVPDAPVITSVDPDNESCRIHFTAPESNGAAITQYTYSVNGGDYQPALQLTSPLTIFSLDNSANYTVNIKAVNAAGASAASNTSEDFVPFTIPEPPVITQILSGDKCVYVYYTCIAYGAPVLSYQYSTGAAFTDFSGIQMPFVIPNLTNKTVANVTIRAINKAGTSPISNLRSVVVGSPQIPLVTSLEAGDKLIKIYFSFQAKNGTIKQINGTLNGGSSFVKLVGTDVSSVTMVKLNNGDILTPQIQLVNENGVSDWSLPIGTVRPAAVPSKIIITSQAFNELGVATIGIGATASNGAPIQKFQYSINADPTLYDISGMTSPFIIRDLSNNVPYAFKLYAVNDVGISLASAASKIITSAFLPPTIPSKVTSLVKRYNLDLSGGLLYYLDTPIFDASGSMLPGPFSSDIPLNTSEKVVQYVSDTSAVAFVLEAAFTASTAGPLTPVLSYKYSINGAGTADNNYIDTYSLARPMRLFVAPNTNYTISLQAKNAAGSSAGSVATKPSTFVLLPPTPPTIKSTNTVMLGSGNATVTIGPSVARGVDILKYSYSLDNGTTIVDLSAVNVTTGVYFASGLPNNTSITNLKVAAYSYIGYSAWSAAAKAFTILYSAPAVPVLASPTVTGTSVSVNFPVPLLNGAAITGYTYTLIKGTDEPIIVDVGTTLPIVITDLALGTYTISVKSKNSIGTSASSATKTFVIK